MSATKEAFGPYLGRLSELPFVREASLDRRGPAGGEVDALVRLRTPDGKYTMPAVLKRTHLTRELGHRFAHLGASLPGLLVLAPAVGRELGEELAQAHVNYVDLAGNCHVRIGDHYLARVEGRRAAVPAAEKSFRSPAYRVLLALLVEPSLVGATARALAEAAGGVSAQTAVDLRARAKERRILVARGSRLDWRPGGRKEALDTLVAGFSATLQPSLALGRFRSAERDVKRVEAQLKTDLGDPRDWRWGGGAACDRLSGQFRGDRTHVYLARPLPPDLPSKLRLIPDPVGMISFALSPGPLAFERSPHPETVHPVLAYLDLLSDPEGRAKEGAAVLYDRWLAKEFAE